MADKVKIVAVRAENLEQEGFFCYKSKRKALGYHRKQEWLRQRFAEGMRIRILYEGPRSVAFIEYTTGEYAWRPVNAAGYMFIHCLWTVGKAKRKGYATRLLSECIEDAHAQGMRGVATVTSTRSWLTGPKWFLAQGFESVDKAPPTFDLLANRFDDGPSPSFPHNWEERCKGFGDGLTVVRADQCPYIDAAAKAVVEAGNDVAVPVKVVEYTSAVQVQQSAPSAYGVFGIVYNGELLSYYLPRDLRARLAHSHRWLPPSTQAIPGSASLRRRRRLGFAAGMPADRAGGGWASENVGLPLPCVAGPAWFPAPVLEAAPMSSGRRRHGK